MNKSTTTDISYKMSDLDQARSLDYKCKSTRSRSERAKTKPLPLSALFYIFLLEVHTLLKAKNIPPLEARQYPCRMLPVTNFIALLLAGVAEEVVLTGLRKQNFVSEQEEIGDPKTKQERMIVPIKNIVVKLRSISTENEALPRDGKTTQVLRLGSRVLDMLESLRRKISPRYPEVKEELHYCSL